MNAKKFLSKLMEKDRFGDHGQRQDFLTSLYMLVNESAHVSEEQQTGLNHQIMEVYAMYKKDRDVTIVLPLAIFINTCHA